MAPCVMKVRWHYRYLLICVAAALALSALPVPTWAAECPRGLPTIEDAKSNKLYLYFPEQDDTTFPDVTCTLGADHLLARNDPLWADHDCFPDNTSTATNQSLVRPLNAFNVADLPSYSGGTADDLSKAISDVVADAYCDFNVQVIPTKTRPPSTNDVRRTTVGIGSDCVGNGQVNGQDCPNNFKHEDVYGSARETDNNDTVGVDFARVWAGTYQLRAGATFDATKSTTLAQQWAYAIGGTAAHEAGHVYGLSHVTRLGAPNEDLLKLLMPDGDTFKNSPKSRADRRHFGDTSYGVLAANVGLSVQTIHNWDFTNHSEKDAHAMEIVVFSQVDLARSWFYDGPLSPWTDPTILPILSDDRLYKKDGPIPILSDDPLTFHGKTYNAYKMVWKTGKDWQNGASGVVPAGATFHTGAAFSGIDFSVSDAVIVRKVTLLDADDNPVSVSPRVVAYDTGSLDASDGTYAVNFFNIDNPQSPLVMRDVLVRELPRLASIDSMVAGATPTTWDGLSVVPWRSEQKLCDVPPVNLVFDQSCFVTLAGNTLSLPIAKLAQGRHIVQKHDGTCPPASPGSGDGGVILYDSSSVPDVDGCPSAGISIDLFPSTTVYVTATIVDPAARHWDPASQTFVVGPVESHLFYQIEGRHPDLNRNGIDDFIDIENGTSTDLNGDGVPDEAQRCLNDLRELEACETKQKNLNILLADIERQAHACREMGHPSQKGRDEREEHGDRNTRHCSGVKEGDHCREMDHPSQLKSEERERHGGHVMHHCARLEERERALRSRFLHQVHACKKDLRTFKRCEKLQPIATGAGGEGETNEATHHERNR